MLPIWTPDVVSAEIEKRVRLALLQLRLQMSGMVKARLTDGRLPREPGIDTCTRRERRAWRESLP